MKYQLYTIPMIAKILSVSVRTVWNLVSSKQIRTVKVGRATRITEEDLDRYLERIKAEANENRHEGIPKGKKLVEKSTFQLRENPPKSNK